jgi:DnaJ-domain-containing protein 1
MVEIAVILFGLFAGYWVVSKLFFRSAPAKRDAGADSSATVPDNRPQWYEILQVDAAAADPEIHEAYRRLISQYHPDKVESLGQELKDLAAKKSQEITAAYREGMGPRGGVR